MADFRIAVGETTPTFDVILERDDGEVADLSSASVQFYLIKHGQTFVDGHVVTVLDAPTGSVRYAWQAGDLTETGVFAGIFKATYAGPLVEYFEFVVEVTDGVGISPPPPPPPGPTYVNSVNGRTGVVVGVLDTANNLSDVASASLSRDNLGLGDSATRDVGTTAGTVAAGDDSRFTDPATPTGPAGGVLSGTYPNPGFAADMATQAELDAGLLTRNRLHGFPNRTDSTITFNAGTRLFTVAPTGADFDIHIDGVLYTKTTDSLTVANTDGPHFVYYDSAGVLTQSTSAWNILTDVPIALVIWSTTANTGFMCEERHTDIMDAATHDYLHATRGTQLKARPALTGYTLSPAVPANADNTPAISADCILADEDIYSSLAAVADGGGASGYSVLWRTGASEWTWTTGLTLPFVNTVAGYINANTLSGTWGQTQLANNQYVNYWLLAVPAVTADARYQFLFIPGQQIHSSLSNAQAESVGASLVLTGLPFAEFAFTHRLTFRTSNTYASTGQCRLEGVSIVVESVATITAATATAASSVTNTPAGNIAATNVQAALNELDSEKVAKAGDTFTGTLAGTLAAATTDAITTNVTADTFNRLVLNADGTIEWGSGSAATDVTLRRLSANALQVDDEFRAVYSVTDSPATLGHRFQYLHTLTADASATWSGLFLSNTLAAGSNNSTGTIRGAQLGSGISGTYSGTAARADGVYSQVSIVSGATLTLAYGYVAASPTGTGTITTTTGVEIQNQGRTGTTTAYGLTVAAQTGAATTNVGARIGVASTYTLWVGSTSDSTTAAGGITFGSSGDTNLYRSAANVLKTDDAFHVSINAGIGTAPIATSLLTVGGTPTSTSTPQIGADVAITGNGSPTNMYGLQIAVATAASSTVTTAQGFRVTAVAKGSGGTLTNAYGFTITPQTAGTNNYSAVVGASSTATLWLSYDANNTNAEAGIAFGLSRDTNLYRSAANTLKTDDAFVSASSISAGASPAQSGTIRIPNSAFITGRNAADSGDVNIFALGGDDALVLGTTVRFPTATGDKITWYTGGAYTTGIAASTLYHDSVGIHEFRVGGTAVAKIGSAYLSVGTNPASTGAIRLPNNQYIYARNAANSADIALARLGTTDIALYGEGASSIRFSATTEFRATSASLNYLLQVTNDQAAAAGVGAGISLRGTSGANQMGNIGAAWDGAANTDANMTFQVRSGGTPTTALTIASTLAATFAGDVTLANGKNLIFNTSTGTKIGTATSQKLSLWNATPDVQPTTGIAAATFVANTSGIVNDTATYGGYTMGQVVAALQRIGALA